MAKKADLKKVESKKPTQLVLLQGILDALEPVSNLAKYQIQQINAQIALEAKVREAEAAEQLMKESKLIETINKVESLGRVLQQVIFELEQIKTLAIGNMELVKLLPGYEEALEQMKLKQEEQKDEPKLDLDES